MFIHMKFILQRAFRVGPQAPLVRTLYITRVCSQKSTTNQSIYPLSNRVLKRVPKICAENRPARRHSFPVYAHARVAFSSVVKFLQGRRHNFRPVPRGSPNERGYIFQRQIWIPFATIYLLLVNVMFSYKMIKDNKMLSPEKG